MAGSLRASSISSTGFLGLNTQESEVSVESGFATQATNCIIDRYGRLGSRRGWKLLTTDPSSISTGDVVDSIFEFKKVNGSIVYLCSSSGKLYEGLENIVEKKIRDATNTVDILPTTTEPNFQWASTVKGAGTTAVAQAFVAQAGQSLLCYNVFSGVDYIFQRVGDVGSVPTGLVTTTFDPNCITAAFGRLWAANITSNKLTVWYSRLLDCSHFTGAGSGLLDISAVVGNNDEIVALASHNNFLIIFCKNNIVVYQNADDPTVMSVADVISGVGCIARDSVQNTGTDLVFLSQSGVRSFARTIQEKSMPMRELSINVRDTLLDNITNEFPANIKSVYFERDAFYLLLLPSTSSVYCFDMRTTLENGASRTTTWNNIAYKCFFASSTRLFLGVDGGIAEYLGYLDGTEPYRMVYFTAYSDIATPQTLKILKKISVTVLGNSSQSFVVKYGFDYKPTNSTRYYTSTSSGLSSEYNIAEYGLSEFSGGLGVIVIKVNAGGTGDVLKFGIETDINDAPVSIQKAQVYLKVGKLV